MPSHESEALEDKQKLQMKTFSELAECLARIPPKITLYGLLFRYNYVGCLLLLMLVLVSKGTRISSRKQDDFVGFRGIRSSTSGGWLEKSGKHVGPNLTLKPNMKARSLLTILYWIKLIPSLWSELLEVRWQSLAKIRHDFFVIAK